MKISWLARRAPSASARCPSCSMPDTKSVGTTQFTVEDEGAFTTAWSATKTYRRVFCDWPENICAENPHRYSTESDAAVSTADKADF